MRQSLGRINDNSKAMLLQSINVFCNPHYQRSFCGINFVYGQDLLKLKKFQPLAQFCPFTLPACIYRKNGSDQIIHDKFSFSLSQTHQLKSQKLLGRGTGMTKFNPIPSSFILSLSIIPIWQQAITVIYPWPSS